MLSATSINFCLSEFTNILHLMLDSDGLMALLRGSGMLCQILFMMESLFFLDGYVFHSRFADFEEGPQFAIASMCATAELLVLTYLI